MPDLDLTPAKALDAYPTAKPDEPTFTLQGGDPFAPGCVSAWVARARAFALTLEDSDPRREELLLRATNAEEVVWTMQAYQRNEPADSNVGEAMTQGYTHGAMTEAGTTETRDKLVRHRLLLEASRSIDNAVAILTDLGLPTLAENLKLLSIMIRPAR